MRERLVQNRLAKYKEVNKLLTGIGGQKIIHASGVMFPTYHEKIRKPGLESSKKWMEAEKRKVVSLHAPKKTSKTVVRNCTSFSTTHSIVYWDRKEDYDKVYSQTNSKRS